MSKSEKSKNFFYKKVICSKSHNDELEVVKRYQNSKQKLIDQILHIKPELKTELESTYKNKYHGEFISANIKTLLDSRPDLNPLYKEYCRTRNDVIEHFKFLAESVSKRFSTRYRFDYDDIYQEAMCSMCKAVDRFDMSLGTIFGRYAIWVIIKDILEYISKNSKIVSIPKQYASAVYKALEIESSYKGSDESKYKAIKQLLDKANLSYKTFEKLKKFMTKKYVNLHGLVFRKSKTKFVDIFDYEYINPADIVEYKDLKDFVKNILDLLPERLAKCLKMKYGLDGFEEHSFSKIGSKFGVCKQRVAGILEIAERKFYFKINLNERKYHQ